MNAKDESLVVFATSIAKEFPEPPTPEVDRSNIIQTVDRLFADTPVVFLDSNQGSGATTVCAQFCNSHADSAIGLFIKPASRIAYSADYLRLVLAEQFHWYIEETRFPKDIVSPEEFNVLRLKLRSRASKARPIYLVVDGLHQIPNDDERAVETVMREILPIGWDNFRFLIVGDEKRLLRYLGRIQAKEYYLTSFSFQEAKVFFDAETLGDAHLHAIHAMCKGLPGNMASVRRMLRGGKSLEAILDADPSQALGFVKLEFSVLDELSDAQLRALSIIAFSSRHVSKDEVVEMAGAADADIAVVLQRCTFLRSNGVEIIEFVSDSHRKFAARRLEVRRNESLKAQIDYLLKNPGGTIALRFLPTYYQQLGQVTELIQLLTSDHFSSLLKSTASIGTLRSRAELGLASALQANMLTEMFGFAVKRSLFATMSQSSGLGSEVRALVATGQTGQALTLANRSTMKEERLGFLCSFARQCKESKISIDEGLLRHIQEEASSVDFAEMGEAAVDLAADLVAVDPDLAMSIVEKATQGRRDAGPSDRSFAHVGVNERRSADAGDATQTKPQDRVHRKITEKFASAVMGMLAEMSLTQVIGRIADLEGRHRVPFLCTWIRMHRTDPEAVNIAEHALDAMIDETTYTPKMSDLCDLAITLPFAGDKDYMVGLIGRFDSQRGLIRDTAVSSRSIQLQMTLAHAEQAGETGRCADRILDAYYEVAGLQSVDTKLDCLAVMLRALRCIDSDGKLEEHHGVGAIIRADIKEILTTILAETAEQFFIVRRALEALAVADFRSAVELASSLNTQTRRDEGFVEVLRALYEESATDAILANCADVALKIQNSEERESEISQLLYTLHSRKDGITKDGCTILMNLVDKMRIPEERAPALAFLAGVSGRCECEELADQLLDKISPAVEMCAVPTFRANMYFTCAWVIAKWRPDDAKAYYEAGRRCMTQGALPGVAHVQAVVSCLGLSIRAIGGLARVATIDDDTIARFTRLVGLVPVPEIRIEMHADLACRAWLAGKRDFARVIVANHCVTLIDETAKVSAARSQRLIERAFPAIFLSIHHETAFDYLERLPNYSADGAVLRTINILLNRRTWTDPRFDEKKERFAISAEDGRDVCGLIENLRTDSSIYFATSDLCQTVLHKHNRTTFTAQQREKIASRLRSVFRNKLPDPNNICHDGYVILATACEWMLSETTSFDAWRELIGRGRLLSNTADRAYVLHELAERVPKKYVQLISETRSEAFECAGQIPSEIDKISRIIRFSSDVGPDGSAQAKAALRAAMLATFATDDQEFARQRRREIIDVAAKLGEDFADELADLLDEDPARAQARKEVRNQLQQIEVTQKLANTVEESRELEDEEESHLQDAAWTALNRLMSGRLDCKNPEAMSGFLRQGSDSPIESAFPVLSWHIENFARKYANSRSAEDRIRPIVEQLLTSAELTVSLVGAVTERQRDERIGSSGDVSDGLLSIGKREEALRLIEEWLSHCNAPVILCDPYFSPGDVAFLSLVLTNCPACPLTILTSKQELQKHDALGDERFADAWAEIRDQQPPPTRFVAISHADTSKTLLHDRWLISGDRGLRMGTSFGSIGKGKLSEISVLRPNEAQRIGDELRRFANEESPIEGHKIRYITFRLS
ncbi:hypothetical protein [Caballeronia sp. GAWG2-1]|uniref:hypothetical protein n=1 Tax=Caballeronia sp. GAWG2-1 TaxID=2921744 RepID=UPI0020294153|nr:hypothetical protein [Caballeronia sp. GAWG2-1]